MADHADRGDLARLGGGRPPRRSCCLSSAGTWALPRSNRIHTGLRLGWRRRHATQAADGLRERRRRGEQCAGGEQHAELGHLRSPFKAISTKGRRSLPKNIMSSDEARRGAEHAARHRFVRRGLQPVLDVLLLDAVADLAGVEAGLAQHRRHFAHVVEVAAVDPHRLVAWPDGSARRCRRSAPPRHRASAPACSPERTDCA